MARREVYQLLLDAVASAGVVSYLVHVLRHRTRGLLERNLLLLLATLATLLGARLVRGALPGGSSPGVDIAAIAVLPLAATLFTEALLRRHAPPAIKVGVAGGTVGACAALLATPDELAGAVQIGVGAYAVMALVALLGRLVRRDPDDLSRAEGAAVNAVIVAALLCVALGTIDLVATTDEVPVRVFGVGALAFVYACVRVSDATQPIRTFVREAGWLSTKAALVGLALLALTVDPTLSDWVAVTALGAGLALLLAIGDQLLERRRRRRGAGFRRWLLETDMTSLDQLLAALPRLPMAEQHVVLRREDLAELDAEALLAALSQRELSTLDTLRQSGAGDAGAEALTALLETYDMRQAVLVSERPPVLLLINLPDLDTAEDWLMDLALLRRYAVLLAPEPRVG